MPTLTSIFLLMTATVLLGIVPGPDMFYILARSTGQGRSAGLVSCIGIAVGGVLQTTALALGLSGLFLVVPVAYQIIKYAGAVYLVYLGVRTILSREDLLTDTAGEKAGLTRVFLQGTITTLLNPKVAFFYLAFLPQFVNQAQGHVPLQLLLLGLIFNITGLVVDSTIALLASLLGLWLKGHKKAARLLQWFSGGVLVGLGIRLAFARQE